MKITQKAIILIKEQSLDTVKLNCLTLRITPSERKKIDKILRRSGDSNYDYDYYVVLRMQYDIEEESIGYEVISEGDIMIFKLYYK